GGRRHPFFYLRFRGDCAARDGSVERRDGTDRLRVLAGDRACGTPVRRTARELAGEPGAERPRGSRCDRLSSATLTAVRKPMGPFLTGGAPRQPPQSAPGTDCWARARWQPWSSPPRVLAVPLSSRPPTRPSRRPV